MREAATANGRKIFIHALEKADADIEKMPAAPFGALLVILGPLPDKKVLNALAKRMLKAGCAWITVHAGKFTPKLHDVLDAAIVDYQLREDGDCDCMTSGEAEDNLAESVRDAVFHGFPAYGTIYPEMLALVIGPDAEKTAEQIEALAKKPEDE